MSVERYTKRLDDGQSAMDCEQCKKMCGKYSDDCSVLRCRNRLKDRVAAYEDTGLEPQEIEKIRQDVEAGFLKQTARRYGVDVDRIRELVEADRDGRCVVLACKVGDRVWVTTAYGKQYDPPIEGHIYQFVLHDDEIVYLEAIIWMDIGDGRRGYGYTGRSFGKVVFLTRESAEAALKGEGDGS